jgi:hypothetical protein
MLVGLPSTSGPVTVLLAQLPDPLLPTCLSVIGLLLLARWAMDMRAPHSHADAADALSR